MENIYIPEIDYLSLGELMYRCTLACADFLICFHTVSMVRQFCGSRHLAMDLQYLHSMDLHSGYIYLFGSSTDVAFHGEACKLLVP